MFGESGLNHIYKDFFIVRTLKGFYIMKVVNTFEHFQSAMLFIQNHSFNPLATI